MQDVFKKLSKVFLELRQTIVDEWEARCQGGTICRPVGYLFQIIANAQDNKFRVCAVYKQAEQKQETPVQAKLSSKDKRDDIVSQEQARKNSAQIKEMFKAGNFHKLSEEWL